MNPRKVGAPDEETSIVDDFGREERILEEIVVPDDQITRPLEIFPLESGQAEAAQRTTVLDSEKPVFEPRRSILRLVGAVGVIAVSIGLAVMGGAAVRNRLNPSVLSEYVDVLRTRTSAVREFLPQVEVVRDSTVAASTTGTDSPPATVAATDRVAAEKPENVKVAVPRPRQKPTSPPARASLPSARRPASSSLRASATSRPAPPVRPAIERAEQSPPPPVISASTAPPPSPAVSSTPPEPAVNPVVPLVPERSAAPPSAPSPPPPAAVSAPSAAPTGGLTAETRAVAETLNRYQDAFSALDANAAHAVWPSVDVKALAKAFDQLEAQTFDLEGCDITVTGARAEADCAGNARYVRKVGNRALRVEPRRWRFALRQANGQWVIDAVDAR